MKTVFILSPALTDWTALFEKKKATPSSAVLEWCEDNLAEYSTHYISVVAYRINSGILLRDWRVLIDVKDEDDALLFALRWWGVTGLTRNFLGPMTSDDAHAEFRASDRMRI